MVPQPAKFSEKVGEPDARQRHTLAMSRKLEALLANDLVQMYCAAIYV